MKTENLYTTNCIRTYSGLYFDFSAPTKDMICIEDVAHALSHLCRFGGHSPEFYSVAQHCCYVANACPDEFKKEGLLHDAAEAYMLDVPKPMKRMPFMSGYVAQEELIHFIIARKFGIPERISSVVKQVDQLILIKEWNTFVLKEKCLLDFSFWKPEQAKQEFLNLYNKLNTK
jgi:hypothetical protein